MQKNNQSRTFAPKFKPTSPLEQSPPERRQPKLKAKPISKALHGPIISQNHLRAELTEDVAIYLDQKLGKGGKTLKMVPLGGMREIGKNMTVYEYNNDLIIVDVGTSFPDDDMPGVDAIIPDFTYVAENIEKLRGVFVTHGHEDHIGALARFLGKFNVPVYGNRLTIKLIENKLNDRDSKIKNASLHVVTSGQTVRVGDFAVEFIHVNHSIADANMLALHTPIGVVIHSGDFKIDYTPIHGGVMDLPRIAELGREGVLALVSESTNVEIPGTTPSERTVGDSFNSLFCEAHGRIFVATFSSNVFRLQQVITAAENNNRKVAMLGRSMLRVFAAANELGYIDMKPDTLISEESIDTYAPHELVLLTTGSQGESLSALNRMAFSGHPRVGIVEGDLVILSSSVIPGNEKPIYRMINELFKRGAKVIYRSIADIHVSGHAYRDELKLLLALTKPQYFIPAHGEYRHLAQHASLAHDMGVDWQNIFVLNNGDILELTKQRAEIVGFTAGAGVIIDGSGMGDVDKSVISDRRILADDGVISISLAISRTHGTLLDQPIIQVRGFIYDSVIDQTKAEVTKRINTFMETTKRLNKPLALSIEKGALRKVIKDYLFKTTHRRPFILISCHFV